MKKFLSLAACLTVIASLAIGGTVAYLTDTDEDVNVMTLGNVDIEQNEQQRVNNKDKQTELEEFEQGKPLFPAVYEGSSIPWAPESEWVKAGDQAWKVVQDNANVIDKFVTVKNTGKSDAYVRTIIAFEENPFDNNSAIHIVTNTTNVDPQITCDVIENVTIDGVQYTIGVYTYPEKVAPGETTIPSLKQVYMGKEATNEDVAKFGNTYDILVVSQAVQTQGFADAKTALNAGFGEITAENHPWKDGVINTDVKTISTAAELLALAGRNDVTGTYALTADINLNGADLKSIGVKYGGKLVFNGNGHTISNANLVEGGQNGMTNMGLFYVETDSILEVSNLTIKNAKVTDGVDEDTTIGAAAAVGYANGGSTVVLKNVDVVDASINNTKGNAALLIGYTVGKVTLTDCDVTGTATGEKAEKTGAFIGTANTADCVVNITNCTNRTEMEDFGRVINNATVNGAVTKIADVSTTDALKTAAQEGTSIIYLNANMEIGEVDGTNEVLFASDNVVINGNNKTITLSGNPSGYVWPNQNNAAAGLTHTSNGANDINANTTMTIKNVTFVNNKDNTNASTSANRTTDYTYARTGKVVYENCTFKGGVVAYENAEFINCKFEETDNNRYCIFFDHQYGTGEYELVLDGCEFVATGAYGTVKIADDAGAVCNVTVKNCKFTVNNTSKDYVINVGETTEVKYEGSNVFDGNVTTKEG